MTVLIIIAQACRCGCQQKTMDKFNTKRCCTKNYVKVILLIHLFNGSDIVMLSETFECHPTFTDKKVCRPLVAICFANKHPHLPLLKTSRGTQMLFRCSHHEKFAKLACNLVLQICEQRLFRCSYHNFFAKLACNLVLQICDMQFHES